ncbi:MAG TPA: aspartate kinase [Armatimonadota bacterium]|nr:aspartate kinase [Armatimonadota bacterium]
MAVIVQKYGGSSVAGVEKIRAVARKIAERRAEGNDLVVVVSAMGDTTDELLALANGVTENPSRRELDMLLTAGERISMALLSMALNALDVPAISFTGSQSGILTTDAHTNARIVEVRPYRIQEELDGGRVVIVAGYQGVSPRHEVTTLGRGGSDTTAVALAAALGADVCEIYSDVDGVFTADPRVAPQARRLAEVSYEEMQTLAENGARVLNAQAVEFARRAEITILARATAGGAGTRVQSTPPERRVAGVTGRSDLVLLRLSRPERLSELLEWLDARGAPARDVVTSAEAGLAVLTLALENTHGFAETEAELERRFGGDVTCRHGLGAVCVVGCGIGADSTHLRALLQSLDALDVPVEGIHQDALRLLALVPAARVDECVLRLHDDLLPPEEAA